MSNGKSGPQGRADQNRPLRLRERLDRLESMLAMLIERQTVRDWYTTEEVAQLLGKAEFTIREWCRLGRIRAQKRGSGRGPHLAWAISHEELLRYRREGLLPPPRAPFPK